MANANATSLGMGLVKSFQQCAQNVTGGVTSATYPITPVDPAKTILTVYYCDCSAAQREDLRVTLNSNGQSVFVEKVHTLDVVFYVEILEYF
ncbi:hypothetical protein [Acidovorax sp. BLS4]|uniref:hypothetical protein n=1 Tax=Acidovorax sp. BLS4 TaxID=3273430 RepID=UPI0029420772|nr:hypothetical protein [Paracidovorax avenae]WOI43791.1 hypothetical protein R1Z03_14725 [Paracidovorax avenae]